MFGKMQVVTGRKRERGTWSRVLGDRGSAPLWGFTTLFWSILHYFNTTQDKPEMSRLEILALGRRRCGCGMI